MTSITNSQDVNQLTGSIDKLTSSNKSAETMKDELETLFCDKMTTNEGEEGKAKIKKQIDAIQNRINETKEKIEKINKQIDEVDGKIRENADKIGDAYAKGYENYNSAIQKEREAQKNEFLIACKNAARMAARTAITEYKADSGQSFEQFYTDQFNKELHLNNKETTIGLAEFLQDAANLSAATQSLMGDLEGLTGEIQSLNSELQINLASVSLLERTKNNMADSLIEDAYKNIDTDANIPIFSGRKADVANSILKNFSVVPNGEAISGEVTETKPTAQQTAQLRDKMDEYAATNENKYPGGCWYATYSKNPEVQNLVGLVNNGMIEDLQNLGATNEEILDFVAKNWNVGLLSTQTKDGKTYTIPNKSDNGKDMFNRLSQLATEAQGEKVDASGISTNSVKGLQDNGLNVLKQMYEAGFTFKEAMYTFVQTFPDSGITYDVKSQDTRNYGIVSDNNKTGGIYKSISDQILNYWNVSATPKTKDGGNSNITSVRGNNDPMVFQDGDTTYTFLNSEKLEDGKFDYTDGKNNDLLGSENGINELLAYDYNQDGLINGEDIDENGNSALDNLFLMSNKQKESVGELGSQDVDGYKDGSNYKGEGAYTNSVNFDIGYTSAKNLGITEIDLRGKTNTNMQDNVDEGYNDINGSNVINEFTVKKDGKDIVAKETLNTESNLETFYGQVADHQGAGTIGSTMDKNEFDELYDSAQANGSNIFDALNNVKDKLDSIMANAPKDEYGDYSGESVTINAKDYYAMDRIIKNGAKAAQRHVSDESEAAAAAAEATKETIKQMSGNDVDEIIKDKKEEEKKKLDSEE